MSARQVVLTDLRSLATLFTGARAAPDRGIVASALPVPYAASLGDLATLARGALGFERRTRLFIETQGVARAGALVFVGRRPEWVVLFLAARPDPAGAEGAFRLVSTIAAAAARDGAERLYAAVPDAPLARETFFQAGFYSYTTETWYVARGALAAAARDRAVRKATREDAHDLFRLYLKTTPHAVQRAEHLAVADFDVERGAGALAPPHLVEGNPLRLRRRPVLAARRDETQIDGFFVGFDGTGTHPHICKVRTASGEVDLARDLLRAGASSFDPARPVASPVRPYEEHVARALEIEGFRAVGAAMLFVKELAVRVEEPALAPAVVR